VSRNRPDARVQFAFRPKQVNGDPVVERWWAEQDVDDGAVVINLKLGWKSMLVIATLATHVGFQMIAPIEGIVHAFGDAFSVG